MIKFGANVIWGWGWSFYVFYWVFVMIFFFFHIHTSQNPVFHLPKMILFSIHTEKLIRKRLWPQNISLCLILLNVCVFLMILMVGWCEGYEDGGYFEFFFSNQHEEKSWHFFFGFHHHHLAHSPLLFRGTHLYK